MMERKNRFRSRILSVCIITAMMLSTVVMTSVTAFAATDLSTGGSSFTVCESHVSWAGGLRMSEFQVGTDDPVIGIFDLINLSFTPLKEGVDYNVLYIGRVFNHVSSDVTGKFDKNLPGDYTYKIEGIDNYSGIATVDRFTLVDPNNPEGSTVPPADNTPSTPTGGGTSQGGTSQGGTSQTPTGGGTSQTTPAGGTSQTTPAGTNSSVSQQPVNAAPATQVLVEDVTISKNVSGLKAASTKNSVTASWKAFKQSAKTKTIKKVEVQVSTDPNFLTNVKTKKVGKKLTKAAIKGLSGKTTYFVRARYLDGKGGVSNWSKVKKIKTK